MPLLPQQGGTIAIPQNVQAVPITLTDPAELFYFFAQAAAPDVVWQQGLSGNTFTAALQAPADLNDVLSYLAVDRNDSNVAAVTIGSTDLSVVLPVSLQDVAILVMPTWNTPTWFSDVTDTTTTINFANAPGVSALFYYYYVPLDGLNARSEPIAEGATQATVSLINNAGLVPFAMVNWNTALGVTPEPDDNTLILAFSNPAPANAQIYYFVQFIPTPLPSPIQPIVPVQQPFVISALSADQFATRFSNFFPFPWLSDAAKEPGGVAYALFYAFATQFAYISTQLEYAWETCRLATATDTSLDLFSEDFFGNTLPRLGGESDAHFRQRISAALFQPKVSRPAIVADIESYTGGAVRAIEPWNPGDTGSWGTSYFDYDTQQTPSLYGDPSERYQGYLQVQLPAAVGPGVNVWGIDAGAGYDIETGTFWEVFENFVSQEVQIERFIAGLIAQGTTAWTKFVNGFIYPVTTGAAIQIASSIYTLNINLPNLAGLYGLFAQLSLAVPVWLTGTTYQGFTVTFQAGTSDGTWISYLALEVGNPNLNVTSVTAGQTSIDLVVDASSHSVIPMVSWDTGVYYANRSNTGVTFKFNTPAPAAEVFNYMSVPINPNVGTQPVPANADSLLVVVTLDSYHVPFAVANWNTTVGVLPVPETGQILLTFSNPAPSNGSGEVMFVNYQVNA